MNQTIHSLIKDDILHAKLLSHLQGVDIEAQAYVINVSETVFKLLNLRHSPYEDILVRTYFDLIKVFNQTSTRFFQTELDPFAESLHEFLIRFSGGNSEEIEPLKIEN